MLKQKATGSTETLLQLRHLPALYIDGNTWLKHSGKAKRLRTDSKEQGPS
jgi:hypothetical protein